MTLSNEFKIGLIVVLAAFVTWFGFRLMQDNPLLSLDTEVEVLYDRVDGINAGSLVYLRGVKIGSVKSVALTESDSIRVMLSLDNERQLPKGSVGVITATSLVDSKGIHIRAGSSSEMVPSGGRIEGVYAISVLESISAEDTQSLTQGASGAFDGIQSASEGIAGFLDDTTQASFQSSMQNVEKSTEELAAILEGKKSDVDATITSARSLMAELDTLATDNRDQVETTMIQLETTLQELETTSQELNEAIVTLNSILVKMDEGEGSMGLLLNDPSLYQEMDSLSAELKTLTRGINEDPKRYLRHLRLFRLF
ncbi:MAG: MlaD family protein [Balneolaceae bacterium]|nr:MlaD family protein [Balneolaceae bacterium]MDR9446899.1 MlaD family protein [Balneolaceae bacterium]